MSGSGGISGTIATLHSVSVIIAQYMSARKHLSAGIGLGVKVREKYSFWVEVVS